MGFLSTCKKLINIVLVILGVILNWWAFCSAIGIIANKVLHNDGIAETAWKVSLMPNVVNKVQEWVKY